MYALAKLPFLSRDESATLASFLTVMTTGNIGGEFLKEKSTGLMRGTSRYLERLLVSTNLSRKAEEYTRAARKTFDRRASTLDDQFQNTVRRFRQQKQQNVLNTLLQQIHRRLPRKDRRGTPTEPEPLARAVTFFLARQYDIAPGHQSLERTEQQIVEIYLSSLVRRLEEVLDAQNTTEAEQAIDAAIRKLSQADRVQLQEALNLQDLTASTLLQTLRRTGTTTVLFAVIHQSGLGAFLALTSVLHAVFTSVLGITLPFGLYTGATWSLGVLLSPLGLFGLLGGIGGLAFRKQTHHLNTLVLATTYTVLLAVPVKSGDSV